MIFGPELAIRGTEASMHHAVKGMYEERRQALKFFWVGCLFIVLSGVALGFMKFPKVTALIIMAVFAALIVFCASFVKRLAPKFAYEDTDDRDFSELQESVDGVAQTNSMRVSNAQHRMMLRAAQQQNRHASMAPQQHNSYYGPNNTSAPRASRGGTAGAKNSYFGGSGSSGQKRSGGAAGASSASRHRASASSAPKKPPAAQPAGDASGAYGALASTFFFGSSYGASGVGAAAKAAATTPQSAAVPTDKSGNVFVENMLRYAVFADGLLRLFSLDGRELSSHPATEIRVGRDKFWIPGDATSSNVVVAGDAARGASAGAEEAKAPHKHAGGARAYRECAGTTERDTADWLRILDHAAHRLSGASGGGGGGVGAGADADADVSGGGARQRR
mmetsp:Transcript_23046/g.91386  ORF Transcript_23046/g.91386 Transcript_23046/m.91386 type:complete len:391 (+) Transcript_23046:471-1643(+)